MSTGQVVHPGTSVPEMLWSSRRSSSSSTCGTVSPLFDRPPSSRSLTVLDCYITSPSPDGKSPSRVMPILRPPTVWEPRSPLHRPPLQHRTASPAPPPAAVVPPTVAAEDALQCPVPVTLQSSQSELFSPLRRTADAPPDHLLHRLPMWDSADYAALPPSPPPSTVVSEVPLLASTPQPKNS